MFSVSVAPSRIAFSNLPQRATNEFRFRKSDLRERKAIGQRVGPRFRGGFNSFTREFRDRRRIFKIGSFAWGFRKRVRSGGSSLFPLLFFERTLSAVLSGAGGAGISAQ